MWELKIPFSERVYSLNGSANDRSIIHALDYSGGYWEPYLMRVMQNRIAPDFVCLDIGANIGIFTLLMSGLAPAGHVFAFEPSTQNMSYLRQNLALNHVQNATPLRNALWDQPGQIELFYIDELAGCSFIDTTADDSSGLKKIRSTVVQDWMGEIELHCVRDPVEGLRLDDWAAGAGLKRLDFIKMDAEGAEIAILNGARETIRRYRPTLVAEFNAVSLTQYFGLRPEEYYDQLAGIYPKLALIESDGNATPIPDYPWLSRRVETGKGWEDLLCSF